MRWASVPGCERRRWVSGNLTKKIIKSERGERGKARDPKIVLLALESRASRIESSVFISKLRSSFLLFFLSLSRSILFFFDARRRDTPQIQKTRDRQDRPQKKRQKKGETVRICAGSLIKPLEREPVVANASANSSDGNIRAREKRRTFFCLSGGVGERVSCVKVTLRIRSFCVSRRLREKSCLNNTKKTNV